MKKYVFILVWLAVYSPFIYAQHDQEPLEQLVDNEKELKEALAKSKTGTERVHALVHLGAFYIARPGYEQQNISKAMDYGKEALEKSISLNYARGKKDALALLGRAHVSNDDIPSAKNILQQLTDTSRVMLLSYLSEYYWQRSNIPANIDTAMDYAQEIVHISDAYNRMDLKAYGLTNLAITNYFKGNPDKTIHYFEEMIRISKQAGDAVDKQWVYSQLIVICYNKGEYKKVAEYTIEAMKVVKEEGESDHTGLIYHNAALSYTVLQQNKKAEEYYTKARSFFKNMEHNTMFWASTRELISILHKEGRDKEALAIVKQANKDMPPKHKDAVFFMNLSMANLNMWANSPEVAEPHYIAALNAGRGGMNQSIAYHSIINCYIALKKYSVAKLYLDTVWSAVKSTYAKSVISNLHQQSYRVDSALGNYQSAMEHLRKSKTLDDSLMQASTTKQMQELQVQYETEKKDVDLRFKDQNILLLTRQSELQQKDFEQTRLRMQFDSQSKAQSLMLISSQAVQKDKDLQLKQSNIDLLEKEGQLKQSSLRQANLVKNVTFAGIALLAIIILLLYNQYRSKQRRNKEISKKNEKLEQLVNEKEWLLKEIHHRVKNNLQTVVSLLESQSSYLEKDALQAVQSSQHRVYAMSLIHQKLYQENNMATINMSVYLPELVEYLADSFDIRQRIRFVLDISPIDLDVSQAVPIGLITNEAITNAIKYAFRRESHNEITISMQRKDDEVELRIADNGIGFPPGILETKNTSLGVRLMKGLAEDIGGYFNIGNTNGTVITVSFPEDLVIEGTKTKLTSADLVTHS